MGEFQYKAKAANGSIKTGRITAPSEGAAKSKLSAMRLKPLSIKAVAAGSAKAPERGGRTKGAASEGDILGGLLSRDAKGNLVFEMGAGIPSTKELAVFTKQFSIMIERGVPLIQTLGILAAQQRSPKFGRTIDAIRVAIENGATLSDALDQYPKVFDNLYIAMMRAGEISGSLDKIMRQLTTYIEKAAKLKSQLKSAMVYPAIVLSVAFGVVTMLLLFVVPSFAKQYQDNGQELPGLTQLVVDLSNFMVNYYYVLFGGVVGAFMLLNAWRKTESGARQWDALMLKSPVIGDVIQKVAVGRFCSTMSTMLLSGVSILEALNICAASAGNKLVEEFVYKVRDKISQGSTFAEPLTEGTLFPGMVASMVQVGEQTGALDQTLLKIAEIYEEEVDLAVATMKSMIEPIMIVFIGSIVGFIVIAMYLPIFDMAKVVGG